MRSSSEAVVNDSSCRSLIDASRKGKLLGKYNKNVLDAARLAMATLNFVYGSKPLLLLSCSILVARD